MPADFRGSSAVCLGAQRRFFTDRAHVLYDKPLLDARGVEVVPAVHSTHVLAISIVLLQKPRYMYSVKNQVILIKKSYNNGFIIWT
jgi:hypothetical protein